MSAALPTLTRRAADSRSARASSVAADSRRILRERELGDGGKTKAVVREGGSIGAVKTKEDILGCEVFFLGLSLPSHGFHAPNENYDWEQASGGIAAFAHYFETVSGIKS